MGEILLYHVGDDLVIIFFALITHSLLGWLKVVMALWSWIDALAFDSISSTSGEVADK